MNSMEASFSLPPEFEQSLERMVLKIVADSADKANQRQIHEYMGKGSLCAYASVSRATLDEWIRKYNVPFVKIGGKWIIKRSDFDHWYQEFRKSQEQ